MWRGQPSRASIAATAAAATAIAFASTSFANGRYPTAGQIVVDPSDPNHLIVRTTFGVMTSTDAGKSWDWICEGAIGLAGQEDPSMAITKKGSILAGLYEGLAVGQPGGCGWAFVPAVKGEPAVDVSTVRASPSSAVAIIWKSVGQGIVSQLWRADDDGATWTKSGADLPSGFSGVTLDVAPSDPMRMYASGSFGEAGKGAGIEASTDAGATWTRFEVPNSDALRLPYLSAIAPDDADTIYARLRGDDFDELVVSHDGGKSWKQVFQGMGGLIGFALSPDGSEIAVGGTKDGVWRAPTSTMVFAQISTIGARCLTWAAAGLYACGDDDTDGFTIGLSTDHGATFQPIMHRKDLRGPLACPADSSVGATCSTAWPTTQCVIGQTTCQPEPEGNVGVQASPRSTPEEGGCSCSWLPARERVRAWTALAALIAALALRRRCGTVSNSR